MLGYLYGKRFGFKPNLFPYKIQMLGNYPEKSIQNELLGLWQEVVGPNLRNCHGCVGFEEFVMVNVLILVFWDVVAWNSVGKYRHTLMYNTHIITCADILCCVVAVSDGRSFHQPHYCADFCVVLTHCSPIIITAKHLSYKPGGTPACKNTKKIMNVFEYCQNPNFTFSRVQLSFFNCEKS